MLAKIVRLINTLIRDNWVGKLIIHFAPDKDKNSFIRKVEKTEKIDLE